MRIWLSETRRLVNYFLGNNFIYFPAHKIIFPWETSFFIEFYIAFNSLFWTQYNTISNFKQIHKYSLVVLVKLNKWYNVTMEHSAAMTKHYWAFNKDVSSNKDRLAFGTCLQPLKKEINSCCISCQVTIS